MTAPGRDLLARRHCEPGQLAGLVLASPHREWEPDVQQDPVSARPVAEILCISNHFREHGGGVEQMAHYLARELAVRPDWRVTLAAHATQGVDETAQPSTYERLPLRAFSPFDRFTGLPLLMPHPLDVVRLLRVARTARCVILHDCVYLTQLIMLIAAPADVPLLVIKHTGQVRFSSLIGRAVMVLLNRLVFPRLLARAKAVAFVTAEKRAAFADIAGVPMPVVPNGIDTDLFVPPVEGRDGSLLFVGRFVAKKGIEVIREMARQAPGRRFVVAGFGPIDPRAWGLSNVTCVWRPQARELAACYARAGALVIPAETEGTPLVALEALACETPVVIGCSARSPDPALSGQMSLLPVDLEHPVDTARTWLSEVDAAVARSKPDRSVIIAAYGTGRMGRDYIELIDRICAAG